MRGNLVIIGGELVIIESSQAGATVTGVVLSYNPKNPATVSLMLGGDVAYEATIPETAGSGQAETSFAISGVAPGTYSLVVSKRGHTDYTVKDVVVGGGDVDLTQDARPEVRLMALRCGDINGDGMINDMDLAILWGLANFNRRADNASNALCDLNGDGMINDADLAILWRANHYNRGKTVVTW